MNTLELTIISFAICMGLTQNIILAVDSYKEKYGAVFTMAVVSSVCLVLAIGVLLQSKSY